MNAILPGNDYVFMEGDMSEVKNDIMLDEENREHIR